MDKRSIGRFGEELAVSFLQENGLKILDRNYSTRNGEIDIIALDGSTYVFVEVKYRKTYCDYDPLEAITPYKQRRIVKASGVYLYCKGISEYSSIRYDCIGIKGTEIVWIKNAFDAY